MACTQEPTLGCLSGWGGSREGGRSSLWHLGSPAREDMEVGPRLVQSSQGPCRPGDCPGLCADRLLPALALLAAFQGQSEHLCGFSSLSPTIWPTLGHAAYLTPWLQLWRSPGPLQLWWSPGPCSCGGLRGLAARHWTILP